MKKITFLCCLLLLNLAANAQKLKSKKDYPKIDYSKIISSDTAIRERLVFIAWQNQPTDSIYQQQIAIANENKKISKSLWMNDIFVNSNLNEYNTQIKNTKTTTIDPVSGKEITSGGGNSFFPLFNLGITYRFGTLPKIQGEVRKANADIKIAQHKSNADKIKLRALVLRNYEIYKTAKKHADLQNEVANDALLKFNLSEQRYSNNKITLDDLNKIKDNLNAERSKVIDAETKLNIARIDLEELLGITLRDAGVE